MKKLKKNYLLIYSSSKHQSSLNPIQFDPVDLKVNRTKTRYPNFENISDGVTQWKRIARNPGILGARLGVKKKKKMKITRITFESRKKYPPFSQLPKNGPVLVP